MVLCLSFLPMLLTLLSSFFSMTLAYSWFRARLKAVVEAEGDFIEYNYFFFVKYIH